MRTKVKSSFRCNSIHESQNKCSCIITVFAKGCIYNVCCYLFKDAFFSFMTGWQPRWFILESGILSYYKSQEDVNNGCKGSIKMSACDIKGKKKIQLGKALNFLLLSHSQYGFSQACYKGLQSQGQDCVSVTPPPILMVKCG